MAAGPHREGNRGRHQDAHLHQPRAGPALRADHPLGQPERDLRRVPAEKCPGPLRRVTAIVEADGKDTERSFITNNFAWSPRTVAELYRARWAIETFFKELKQTLQLADFVGYNEKAVKWQVWTGLLAHLQLRFLKHVSKWGLSFSRLAGVVRAAVWVKRDLVAILKTYGTAPRPKRGEPAAKPPPLQAFFDFWRFDYGTASP